MVEAVRGRWCCKSCWRMHRSRPIRSPIFPVQILEVATLIFWILTSRTDDERIAKGFVAPANGVLIHIALLRCGGLVKEARRDIGKSWARAIPNDTTPTWHWLVYNGGIAGALSHEKPYPVPNMNPPPSVWCHVQVRNTDRMAERRRWLCV